MSAGPGDLPAVLSALGAVAEATSAEQLTIAALAAAVAVVGADSAVVTAVGASGPTLRTWPEDFLSAEQFLAFERDGSLRPWPSTTHSGTSGAGTLSRSGPCTSGDARRLDIHSEIFRRLDFDCQVAFSVSADPERPLCVAVNRKGKDFTAGELDRIAALQRPLAAAADRVTELECDSGPGSSGVPPPSLVGLSARESEVLALVASGLTNDQVGRRLGISARTVSKHLEHVFAKTGMTNRTQAAAEWYRRTDRLPRGRPAGGALR